MAPRKKFLSLVVVFACVSLFFFGGSQAHAMSLESASHGMHTVTFGSPLLPIVPLKNASRTALPFTVSGGGCGNWVGPLEGCIALDGSGNLWGDYYLSSVPSNCWYVLVNVRALTGPYQGEVWIADFFGCPTHQALGVGYVGPNGGYQTGTSIRYTNGSYSASAYSKIQYT